MTVQEQEQLAGSIQEIGTILERARAAAIDYYRLTGKPLGITGEIGEYEAARLLGLTLAAAREPGFDAIDSAGLRYQIKARLITELGRRRSQQIGAIKLTHPWHRILLVLLDASYCVTAIWQAERQCIEAALSAPGSKSRNERGALAVSKFKSVADPIWTRLDKA
ncbi:hypothetical protein XH83_33830 [Bradyrhizobium sp. CCBAU 53351]|uniref:DUF6998 domain-containing protein n=1 Tax=Bradyrhizobium sp. CCBAU 53351 TaxID=1325114 RepID=UPI001888206C|nr:hypothetical protein [Bradyrhizobium sp. CCBAU 53351]QOZ80785.1 hypothetical protein XH83_33830 [Bradyrhizobium sp. CCBAU 53351]